MVGLYYVRGTNRTNIPAFAYMDLFIFIVQKLFPLGLPFLAIERNMTVSDKQREDGQRGT
jgi:hypothetical protein